MQRACVSAVALLGIALLSAAFPRAQPRKYAAPNPRLAAEIDGLFNDDINDAIPSHAVHARVRQILAEHGLPTNKIVGNQAAEEYMALLSGEPMSFLETVLPLVKQAADAGKVSENAYVYLRAQVRRKKVREKYSGSPANAALASEIKCLGKADQAVRSGAGKKAWDIKKVEETDRADGVTARAIFAQYGLPTFAIVGPEAAGAFATVIQHQPLEFQKQVLPRMKAAAEAGEISAESYAMLLDRVESGSGQPQTYGENFVCMPDGKGKPSPIADAEYVDRRRAEIGLMPLDLYAKVLGELYMNSMCAQVAAANKKAAVRKRPKSH